MVKLGWIAVSVTLTASVPAFGACAGALAFSALGSASDLASGLPATAIGGLVGLFAAVAVLPAVLGRLGRIRTDRGAASGLAS